MILVRVHPAHLPRRHHERRKRERDICIVPQRPARQLHRRRIEILDLYILVRLRRPLHAIIEDVNDPHIPRRRRRRARLRNLPHAPAHHRQIDQRHRHALRSHDRVHRPLARHIHCPVQIRPPDARPGRQQPVQRLLARVSVGIPLPHLDHRLRHPHRRQELGARARVAAVVPHLQHVRRYRRPPRHHRRLDC